MIYSPSAPVTPAALLERDENLADAAVPEPWAFAEHPSAVLAVIRAAVEGSRSLALGDSDGARAAFEFVAGHPLPVPGALTAASRCFSQLGLTGLLSVCQSRLSHLGWASPDGAHRAGNRPEKESPESFAYGLHASRGRDLVAQMAFKRKLVERYGEFDAALCYAGLIAEGTPTEIVDKPLRGLRDATQHSGSVYVRVAAPCELTLPRTEVIGADHLPAETVNGRELFVGCVSEAQVAWRSSVVDTPEAFLYDFQGGELAGVPPEMACDAAAFGFVGSSLRLIRRKPITLHLEQAIALTGAGSYAFGHWITEFLYRLFLIDQAGLAPGVPILVDQGMPASHREALDWFNHGGHPVVEIPVWGQARVDRLWVASNIAYMPFYPAIEFAAAGEYWLTSRGDVMASLTKGARRPLLQSSARHRRLFMARRPQRHRKLVNQADIEARLVGLGYEVIYTEDLSFGEQLRLLEEARFIVGPSGSAMLFAVLWAKPGTRVGFLCPPFLNGIATLNLSALAHGVQLHIVKGDLERQDSRFMAFSDYRIPPARLEALLLQFHGVECEGAQEP